MLVKTRAAQYFEIGKCLEGKVAKVEGGYCKYLSGWDDERVASLTGCKLSSVQTIRKQLYGKLSEGRKDVGQLELRIHDLEHSISRMEECLDSLKRWAVGRGYNKPAPRLNSNQTEEANANP